MKLIPGDGLNRRKPAFAVQSVWIATGEHPTIPGVQTTVHATEAGANASALAMVNIIRHWFKLPVTIDLEAGLAEVKRLWEEQRSGDDPEWDVWVQEYKVEA